jgi:hypothetical protein
VFRQVLYCFIFSKWYMRGGLEIFLQGLLLIQEETSDGIIHCWCYTYK